MSNYSIAFCSSLGCLYSLFFVLLLLSVYPRRPFFFQCASASAWHRLAVVLCVCTRIDVRVSEEWQCEEKEEDDDDDVEMLRFRKGQAERAFKGETR